MADNAFYSDNSGQLISSRQLSILRQISLPDFISCS